MLIPFVKMQAQGNDFVIIDAFSTSAELLRKLDLPALTATICRPKTDVGADGLVLLSPCKTADGQMQIYNADGSRAEMCGSALRCVALLLKDRRRRGDLSLLTDSGLKTAIVSNNSQVSVNLGTPKLLQQNLEAEGFSGDLVDIGNLHFIVWQDDLSDSPHLKYGRSLENFQDFPRPVNVHFVRQADTDRLEMKIWERAVGPTLACGTGAVSSVCSALNRGWQGDKMTVSMPGGEVSVKPGFNGYLLAGEVSISFRGDYDWKI